MLRGLLFSDESGNHISLHGQQVSEGIPENEAEPEGVLAEVVRLVDALPLPLALPLALPLPSPETDRDSLPLPACQQSINQFTFLVLRTHQGSQQTITGTTTYTKH